MAPAIDMTVALALLAAAIVALALTRLSQGIVRALLSPVAAIPYAGSVVGKAERAMLGWLDDLVKRETHWISRFFRGLSESLYLLIGSLLLAFYALFEFGKWAGDQLFGKHGTATVAKLQLQLQNESTKARAAEAAAAHSIAALKALVSRLDKELHTTSSAAITNLTTNVIPKLQHEVSALEKEVAGTAASSLPGIKTRVTALEKAIAGVHTTIGTLTAEITVLENVPPYAPGTTVPPIPIPKPGAPGATGAKGEPGATGATGAAGAPGTLGDITLPDLGTIPIAGAIGAVWAITQAITSEAGLGRAECRAKVKGICGTDPSAWLGLLAGIGAVGVGFSLADIAKEAANLIGETHGLVRDLTDGVIDQAPEIGAVIGGIANEVARV